MAPVEMIIGTLLAILGVGAYIASPTRSLTAFIPTLVGAIINLCGILARKDHLRKHAMHAAVMVALIGFLGGAGMFTVALMQGVELSLRQYVQLAMGALCLVFVALGVRSFIAARRARAAAATAGSESGA